MRGIQIIRLGVPPGGRLGERVADHNGGYLKSSLDNVWWAGISAA